MWAEVAVFGAGGKLSRVQEREGEKGGIMGMARWFCEDCKYEWLSNMKPTRCPYCGGIRLIQTS